MILLQVRELMLAKGMKPSAYTLQKLGIGRNAAKHYLSGKAKSITTDHLYKMCVYFHCTPKEIMYVNLDPTEPSIAGTPIASWAGALEPFHIHTFRHLTPEQLLKAKEAIKVIEKNG